MDEVKVEIICISWPNAKKIPFIKIMKKFESLASSSDDEERLPENVDVKPLPVIKQFQWPVLTCEEDADWREKFVSLPEQFRYMLYNNIRTDCSFIVGSDKRERFHCHKVQLCRASSVFDSMLFDPTYEKGEISLSNIEPGTFKEIVEYIYTDKLLSARAALSLCRAANLYKMSRLRDACELYLRDNLQTEWLWPALEFPMQLPETNSLRDKCLEFLRANTRSCLDTANFMQIEQSTLAWLLQQDLLDIESEMDLISAVTCWAVNKTGGLFDGEATGSNLLRQSLGGEGRAREATTQRKAKSCSSCGAFWVTRPWGKSFSTRIFGGRHGLPDLYIHGATSGPCKHCDLSVLQLQSNSSIPRSQPPMDLILDTF